MPYTLKPNKLFAKDPNGEGYLPQNVVTDQSTTEQVALINSTGAAQVSSIQAKGTQTLDSIPEDYTALQGEVDDLKSAIANNSNYSVISPSWASTNGYIKYADGGVSTSNAWKRSDFDPIPKEATGLYLTVPVVTNELQLQVVSAISFYTSNDATTFITGGSEHVMFGSAQGYTEMYIAIPQNAKYIRVSSLVSFVENYSLKAVLNDSVVVSNYAELLKTTAKKVMVLCNDYQYGDYGPCWFEVTDGWTNGGITRNDGSVVFPLVDQGPLNDEIAPYNKIMSVVKSYVGNDNLVYGNTETLFDTTCSDQIDCSSFVTAVMAGIYYWDSRYVLGTSASNIIGENIGDTIIEYSSGIGRTLSHTIAQYFAMHKKLYRLPPKNIKAINMLRFGDLLFSHFDGVNDDCYFGIGHVGVVIGTIPRAGAVIIAQAGGSGNVSNESTVVKTSCRLLSNNDFVTNYPVFARPTYGRDSDYIIVPTMTNGKIVLNNKNGIRLQLDTNINAGKLAYARSLTATPDFISVPSAGSIVYNGELKGLDANQTPYVATLYRYDKDKRLISSNGILIENTPVTQQITKSGQAEETRFVRITFGHTESQNALTTLADLDRFSAVITMT